MCSPKEPHHFGSDLPRRFWTPYTDREAYLPPLRRGRRSPGRRCLHAYLYSRAAPGEMLTVSPDARILIMLRDPVEMVRASVHDHAMFFGYEDLPDLEQALAAQEDRRQGRRVPRLCHYPLALQYTFTARYAAHVRRYLDAFGREQVKILLFRRAQGPHRGDLPRDTRLPGAAARGLSRLQRAQRGAAVAKPGIARVALSAYYPAYRVGQVPRPLARQVHLRPGDPAGPSPGALQHGRGPIAVSPELGRGSEGTSRTTSASCRT